MRPVCHDEVNRSAATTPRMRRAGVNSVVGRGPNRFIAPAADRWGDVVTAGPKGSRQGKFPIWVGEDALPRVHVERVSPSLLTAVGDVRPTGSGLPGPVPVGVNFPADGCWRLTVTSGDTSVDIEVMVGN